MRKASVPVSASFLLLLLAGPALCMLRIVPPPDLPSIQPPAGLVLKPGVYRTQWVVPPPDEAAEWFNVIVGSCASWEGVEKSIKVKPRLTSTTPIYGGIVFYRNGRLENGGMLFVLDESKGAGSGYDTIIIDANRNGDLSDDQRITSTAIKREPATGEPPGPPSPGVQEPPGRNANERIQISFPSAVDMPVNELMPGVENSNTAPLDLVMFLKPDEQYGWVSLRGYRTGRLDSNKGRIPFALADRTGNGEYGDRYIQGVTDDGTGDIVLFDWSGRGDFSDAKKLHALSLLKKAANIGGRLYSIRCSPAGDRLEIGPVTGPMAGIALSAGKVGRVQLKPLDAKITGEMGTYLVRLDGRATKVPPGTYELEDVTLRGAERGMRGCSLVYSLDKPIELKPGVTSTVRIAGDLELVLAPESNEVGIVRGEQTVIPVAFALSTGGTVKGLAGDGVGRSSFALRDPAGRTVRYGAYTFG